MLHNMRVLAVGDPFFITSKMSKTSCFTTPFNIMRTLKFKGQPTNAFFVTVNLNVRRLLQASDYCRALSNQITSLSPVQST